ncbi:MAG: hypothetical protein LBM98_03485 [Oscillospiraceae bacterium]|nr:hypothetical protein [Oscillospiraceae bacterium]
MESLARLAMTVRRDVGRGCALREYTSPQPRPSPRPHPLCGGVPPAGGGVVSRARRNPRVRPPATVHWSLITVN